MNPRRDAQVQEAVGQACDLPFGGHAVEAHRSRHPALGGARDGPRPGSPGVDFRLEAQLRAKGDEPQVRGRDAVGSARGRPRQALTQLLQELRARKKAAVASQPRFRLSLLGGGAGGRKTNGRHDQGGSGLEGVLPSRAAEDRRGEAQGQEHGERDAQQRQQEVDARRQQHQPHPLVLRHGPRPGQPVGRPGPGRNAGAGLDDRVGILLVGLLGVRRDGERVCD